MSKGDPRPVTLVTLEYDGTDFVGWQSQPNGRAIQDVVERALVELFAGEAMHASASGRTDSGVHAEAQPVSFLQPEGVTRSMDACARGLNALLPRDVGVRTACLREPGFDARFSARGKLYRYAVLRRPGRSPLLGRTSWVHYRPLDSARMAEAAALLVGRHDFQAFRASDCEAKSAVRTLKRLDVTERGELLLIEAEGEGFLKHMVRNLVGSLVDVGTGKRPAAWMGEVLASRNRKEAGPTAPAQGLTLVRVDYDPPPPEWAAQLPWPDPARLR